MIIKERKMPLIIRKLNALLRRLPQHHPQRKDIEASFAKYMAGYRGEESIDYVLGFLPEKEYYILHDVRLSDGVRYFQIDTLIVSSKFILLLEIKNISGTLVFDQTFNQLIRITDEKEEAFPDPILQIQRHEQQFRAWLHQHHFHQIPIESLVITLIKNSRDNQAEHLEMVIHSGKLSKKVNDFERLYLSPILTDKLIKKLLRQMSKKHTPLSIDLLQRFDIKTDELLTGVHCPDCGYLPMKRMQAKWICPKCLKTSKDAHLMALVDYELLLGSTINNCQFRQFLLISSSSIAHKMLCSMNLPVSGSFKDKIYFLHPSE
ncbi:nuclease-related domain-containing protein [Fictibacillus sp. B-59209]|uniref:nuclease-related domain-containing protein n=1 Tax=Fictibacillus sp. B-59209 TaxID=3024873 RepID=UPI002E1F6876|nr:nuclease-related domain-containing protein [Fictibacillus sp. B-59209]